MLKIVMFHPLKIFQHGADFGYCHPSTFICIWLRAVTYIGLARRHEDIFYSL